MGIIDVWKNKGKIFAEDLWYIQMGIGFVSIINFPVNLLQFILISHIAFPTVALPVQVPWWLFMSGSLALMFFGLFVVGYYYTKRGIVKNQSDISNRNNPQIMQIIERLDRIERLLNEHD